MRPEIRKYLFDVDEACQAIFDFVRGKTLEDYESDLLLRSGVERQFMIVGEALHKEIKDLLR